MFKKLIDIMVCMNNWILFDVDYNILYYSTYKNNSLPPTAYHCKCRNNKLCFSSNTGIFCKYSIEGMAVLNFVTRCCIGTQMCTIISYL